MMAFTGTECSDCHNETEWLDIEFDHDTTDYPLLGKHQEVVCGDCHEDKTLRNTPTTCYGCHAENDSHDGRSGQNCENCHNPTSWDDSSFDHGRDTEFTLDGGHASLSCGDCHSEDPFADTLEMACVSCHLEDDHHEQHFGDQCDTCHATDLWTTPFFNHDVDTEHALIGAHESIECIDCHIEPIFEVELLTACNDCHAADDPHDGEQGVVCKDCHNESSWADDVFFDHDLTRFPLLGSHAEVECETCHETHVFRDAPELCVDCHIEDDPHEGRFHEDCASCHNPVDWPEWSSTTMPKQHFRYPARTLKFSAMTATDNPWRPCQNLSVAVVTVTAPMMFTIESSELTVADATLPTRSATWRRSNDQECPESSGQVGLGDARLFSVLHIRRTTDF